jgi:beta-lactam-binding protein with PASTA domain
MPKDDEIERLKAEIARLKAEKFSLEESHKLAVKKNEILEKEKATLEKEKAALEQQVGRPKMTPEALMASLRDAVVAMEDGLQSQNTRVNYSLGTFDADLKTALHIDEHGKPFLQMPFLGETIPAENLSVFKFSINSIPRPGVPLVTVPNVVGRMRDSAAEAIEAVGLKVSITERMSSSPKGTVIGQDPEAYSEVAPGTNVVISVAKPQTVKVPKLIGMEKDVAVKTLESTGLTAGTMQEQISDAEPGIVIQQNPQPDTIVEVGSTVDLIVSAKGVTVPSVIWRPEKEARAIINESNLSVGKVSYVPSLFHHITLGQRPAPGTQVLPRTAVELKVGRLVTVEELKKLLAPFPEAKKLGITPDLVLATVDTYGINTMDRLEEFIEIPDKAVREKLELKDSRVARGLKVLLKRIVEKLGKD